MPCYFPLTGYKSATTTKTGKRKLTFSPSAGYRDLPITVPCGQCIGCRLERSRQWAVRLTHELQGHELAVFLTLTYDDEHLPESGSLVMAHFQGFMKRLRFHHGKKIRFFHCGEYGETTGRPHYHAILFGIDFADKKPYKTTPIGDQIYDSATLDKIWGLGQCWIGQVTFDSCAYVARYITKKVTGDQAEKHYERVNLDGEIIKLQPEYCTMSRRPGIGHDWLTRYASDVFPSDRVVVRGKEAGAPRYYRSHLERNNPKLSQALKFKRIRAAKKRAPDNTPERLAVKHEVKLAQISSLKRNL